MPSSSPSGWDGTATAGAVLYLILFAAALWGAWLLVRGAPAGEDRT